MDWSSKSLLIFDDQVLGRDGDGFGSDESHILFLMEAARRFGRVTFLGRVAPRLEARQHLLPPHVVVSELPFYEDVATLCIRFPRYAPRLVGRLRSALRGADVLWLVWPHPISLLSIILLRLAGARPGVCLFVRGSYGAIVRRRYGGVRKLAALALGAFMEGQLRLWSRRSIVFTVGGDLSTGYRRTRHIVRPIVCSCLTKRQIGPLQPMAAIRKDEGPRLLYVGRFEPEKGLSYLIQAVGILRRESFPVRLDLVGGGAQKAELQTRVKAQGLESVVAFHGPCAFGAELVEHYRRAHLLVLPSLTEGLPKVLIEAMVFGTPVVATRVGSIPTIIEHGRNGWLVKAGSAEALATAIREAGDSAILREAARREAVRDVEPLLLEAQEAAMYESLGELLSSSPRGRAQPSPSDRARRGGSPGRMV